MQPVELLLIAVNFNLNFIIKLKSLKILVLEYIR